MRILCCCILAFVLSAAVVPAILGETPAQPAAAPKPKPPRDLAIFNPRIYDIEPQIDRVLLLTDDQREAVVTLYRKIHESPALVALREKASGKNSDAGARHAAGLELKMAQRDATITYGQKVRDLLTGAQRDTLRQVDDAGVALTDQINDEYRNKILTAATVDQQQNLKRERVAMLKQKGRAAILAVLAAEQKKALAAQ